MAKVVHSHGRIDARGKAGRSPDVCAEPVAGDVPVRIPSAQVARRVQTRLAPGGAVHGEGSTAVFLARASPAH
jgi:hypothetical protein